MTRALDPDEKRVYDLIARSPNGVTRHYLEMHLAMPLVGIVNAMRRLARHGYIKTGWPERRNVVWFAKLPSEK